MGIARRSSRADPSNSLYSAVLYLSPADYHHIHAPAGLAIAERVHIPGRLLPVLEAYAAHVKGLFTLNERVVLAGEWPHGSFALGMVGAYNVGSIRVPNDPVRTNLPHELLYEGHVHRRVFEQPWRAAQGERVGTFALGSTVVLAFEAPQFTWLVEPGQKVRVGQPIGYVRRSQRVREIVETEYPAMVEMGKRGNRGEGERVMLRETGETGENGETVVTGEIVETVVTEGVEEMKKVEGAEEVETVETVEMEKGKEVEKVVEFPTVLEVMISEVVPEEEKMKKKVEEEEEEEWLLVPVVEEKDPDLW